MRASSEAGNLPRTRGLVDLNYLCAPIRLFARGPSTVRTNSAASSWLTTEFMIEAPDEIAIGAVVRLVHRQYS